MVDQKGEPQVANTPDQSENGRTNQENERISLLEKKFETIQSQQIEIQKLQKVIDDMTLPTQNKWDSAKSKTTGGSGRYAVDVFTRAKSSEGEL